MHPQLNRQSPWYASIIIQLGITVKHFAQCFFYVTMYAMLNNWTIVMTSINAMASELIELAGTQAKASEVSGVSQANLSKLAANEIGTGVRADTVEKIKRALTKLRRAKKRAAS